MKKKVVYAILNKKKEHPLQRGCSRKRFIWSLDHASSVGRQERHFYFFLLFLLSRKFRNATTKPPKVQSKVNIPRNIETISKAVIITHLPFLCIPASRLIDWEATTPSWVLFLRVSTQEYYINFSKYFQ